MSETQPKLVTKEDIELALAKIEETDTETANLLRHYIRGLEYRLMLYECDDFDDRVCF